MGWLSDTWREITSLGKADTKTYNGGGSGSSSSGSSSSGGSAKTYTVKQPTYTYGGGTRGTTSSPSPVRQSSGSTSGGGTRTGLQQWGNAPRVAQGPSAATLAAQARAREANAQAAATRDAATKAMQERTINPKLSGSESAATAQQRMGRQMMLDLGATDQELPDSELVAGPDALVTVKSVASPARKKAAAEREKRLQEWQDYREEQQQLARDAMSGRRGLAPNTNALTTAEYQALSPRQQAGVQFNTGLVEAVAADRAAGRGEDTATRDYLGDLGLSVGPAGSATSIDSYLGLDAAISDSVLKRLDNSALRRNDASSLRYARGNETAAPAAVRRSEARSAAATATDAIIEQLRNGNVGGLSQRGQAKNPALAGTGTNPRDGVIQQAYQFMIDPQYDMTAQDVATGLAQMNQANGTDVTPQEVWDFVGTQLDAVDMAKSRGDKAATVTTLDSSITPLSVADIRARYGL